MASVVSSRPYAYWALCYSVRLFCLPSFGLAGDRLLPTWVKSQLSVFYCPYWSISQHSSPLHPSLIGAACCCSCLLGTFCALLIPRGQPLLGHTFHRYTFIWRLSWVSSLLAYLASVPFHPFLLVTSLVTTVSSRNSLLSRLLLTSRALFSCSFSSSTALPSHLFLLHLSLHLTVSSTISIYLSWAQHCSSLA